MRFEVHNEHMKRHPPKSRLLNGSKPPTLHPHNSLKYICVGCGFIRAVVAIAGGNRVQMCTNCDYTAMLPADAPEVEVLRLRVDFLSVTSNEVIERLREVIASQAKQLASLKGEADPELVLKANLAAAEILQREQ